MRSDWKALLLLPALAAPVAAQQQPAQSPPPAAAPASSSATGPAQPAQDLTAQGETVVRRGSALSQDVLGMLQDARKEADIIKVNCLDDKLAQINANLRTAQARLDLLKKAVDPDLRAHEHTVLAVLARKLQVLDQEAHQCVGQALYETGATKVVTEVDTSKLPAEADPSVFPFSPVTGPIIYPPIASSTR
jgi:hypothetical protein